MPQIPAQNIREFNKSSNYDMSKNRTTSMNNQNTSSSEKQHIRGHNLDMRVAHDQYRMREIEYMHNQGHYRQLHHQ